MTFLNRILAATIVASPLFLVGCFNTGEIESTINVVDRFSLKVEVLDAATGEPVPGATVEIVDDPLDIITSLAKSTGPIVGTTGPDGVAEFELDDSQVIDDNNDGQPDDIPNVRVRITKTSPGGVDEATIVSTIGSLELQSTGANSTVFAVSSIDEPPAGVSVSQTSFNPFDNVDESTGELAADCNLLENEECVGAVDADGDGTVDEFVFRAEADSEGADQNHSDAEVELALPANAVLTTADGEELSVEEGLMVVVTAYDAAEPESLNVFPGGFAAQVSNVNDLAEDLAGVDLDGNGSADDELGDGDITETVAMQSAGFAAVEIRDVRGLIAANVTGADRDGLPLSARVRINVSPDAVNPETDALVEAGDKIPVWSLNESTGEWQYESIREVLQAENGGLYTEFETDHFSYFNMDWFRRGEDGRSCSPTFYLRDQNNRSLNVRGSITISGINRQGAGYSKRDYYRGEGYMTYHNSPTVPLTLSFDVDERGKSFELLELVGVVGDISDDGRRIDNVQICDSAGGVVIARIVDEVPPPIISVVRTTSVVEGESAQFTLNLDVAAPTDVTVDFNMLDGTSSATAGSDYNFIASQTFTIPAGQRSVQFSAQTIDDAEQERYESIQYQFANLSGAESDSYFTNPAYISIVDNDAPLLSIDNVSISEDAGTATVTVSIDKQPLNNVYVRLGTIGGTAESGIDFQPSSKTVYFTPTSPASHTLSIDVINDGSEEADETFNVVARSSRFYVSNPNGQAESTVTIVDDGDVSTNDPSELEVDIEVASEVFEGRYGANVPVVVTLNKAFDRVLDVNVQTTAGTAVDGTDYRGVSSNVRFPAGETRVRLTNLRVLGDTRPEETETFTVEVSNARVDNVASAAVGLPVSASTASIIDDDQAKLRAYMRYGYENQSTANLLVYLDRVLEVDTAYTIEFTDSPYQPATQGADFSVAGGNLSGSIPAGQTSVNIPVTIVDDNIVESTEYIRGNVTGLGQQVSFYGAILDNDAVKLSVGSASATEGGLLTFQINVSGGERPGPFQVRIETRDNTAVSGNDYTARNQNITIPAGVASVDVNVQTVDDSAIEDDELMYLLVNRSTASFRVIFTNSVGNGTILDNDGRQQTGTGGGSDGSQTGGGGDGI